MTCELQSECMAKVTKVRSEGKENPLAKRMAGHPLKKGLLTGAGVDVRKLGPMRTAVPSALS